MVCRLPRSQGTVTRMPTLLPRLRGFSHTHTLYICPHWSTHKSEANGKFWSICYHCVRIKSSIYVTICTWNQIWFMQDQIGSLVITGIKRLWLYRYVMNSIRFLLIFYVTKYDFVFLGLSGTPFALHMQITYLLTNNAVTKSLCFWKAAIRYGMNCPKTFSRSRVFHTSSFFRVLSIGST